MRETMISRIGPRSSPSKCISSMMTSPTCDMWSMRGVAVSSRRPCVRGLPLDHRDADNSPGEHTAAAANGARHHPTSLGSSLGYRRW